MTTATASTVLSRQRPGRRHTAAFAVALIALGTATSAGAVLPAALGGDDLPTLAPVIERVRPAVVNIGVESRVALPRNPLLDDPFFRRFFNVPDGPRERRQQGIGSGVIVDAQRGLIITNNHVIEKADQITVKLADGRQFPAETVGTDPETDVAVIRIPPERLTAIPVADSERLRVGDFVVAVGNPFGLEHTVTSGIVSALARSGLGIGGYEDYIQTDASINPGNSGGALVNLRGELIGINTAIFSQTGNSIGIGFAIPSNMARRVMEQLVQFGEVKRGFIGAQMQDLDPALADAFGVKQRNGAVLVDIAPESPAALAGLKPGDIIVGVDGKAVENAADVRNRVGLGRVGDTVKLDVLRNGRQERVVATIGERKVAAAPTGTGNPRLAGVTLAEIDPRHPLAGQVQGVMVDSIETASGAWQAGLRQGDVVLSVNRIPTPDLQRFVAAIESQPGALVLQVRRGNAVAFMVLK